MHLHRAQAGLSQWLVPIVENAGIRFYCPRPVEVWRAYTLLSKEPETLEWIDGFEPNSVFWDVGSNVGLYTLYATERGHHAVAFEPDATTYAISVKNVELNRMPGSAQVFNVALGDGIEPVYGSAMGVCGDDVAVLRPDYLKVDVDGPEMRVLAGMSEILDTVREVLIEMDGIQDKTIESFLNESGLEMTWKRQSAMVRDSGKWSKFHNARFTRQAVGIKPVDDRH